MAAAAAAVGEDLGAGAARHLRRRRPGHARVGADVGGDVLEVLAADDVGRHRGGRVVRRRARVLDLGLDDPLDRAAGLAGFARGGESVVEVGTDLRAGSGLGHFVAFAAVLDEEDPAALLVGLARAATCHGRGDRGERGQDGEQADFSGSHGHSEKG